MLNLGKKTFWARSLGRGAWKALKAVLIGATASFFGGLALHLLLPLFSACNRPGEIVRRTDDGPAADGRPALVVSYADGGLRQLADRIKRDLDKTGKVAVVLEDAGGRKSGNSSVAMEFLSRAATLEPLATALWCSLARQWPNVERRHDATIGSPFLITLRRSPSPPPPKNMWRTLRECCSFTTGQFVFLVTIGVLAAMTAWRIETKRQKRMWESTSCSGDHSQ